MKDLISDDFYAMPKQLAEQVKEKEKKEEQHGSQGGQNRKPHR